MYGLVIAAVLVLLCGSAHATNTHGYTSSAQEMQAYQKDGQSPFVVSGCTHPTSGSTSATVASCRAYVLQDDGLGRTRHAYVEQDASVLVDYAAGDGTYYLAVHESDTLAVGGWTRIIRTHYIFQKTATAVTTPNGALVVLKATVAAGAITDVLPMFRTSPSFDERVYGAVYGMVCDGLTDNVSAFNAAVAAIKGEEGTLVLPASDRDHPCIFASGITFGTKALHLLGHGGARVRGSLPSGTRLRFTGTGAFIALNSNAQAGSILEGFDIDNTNAAATYAITVDTSPGVVMKDVSVAIPTVPFSTAAIGLGIAVDTHTIAIHQCFLRGSAPIGVIQNDVTALFIVDSTIQHHTVANVKVGHTVESQETHIMMSRLESNDTGAGIGVWLHNASDVYISESHFEVGQDSEGGVVILNSDVKCTNCNIFNSRFSVLSNAVAGAASVLLDAPGTNPTFHGKIHNNFFKDNRAAPQPAIVVNNTSTTGGANWLVVADNQIENHTIVVSNPQNVINYYQSYGNHRIGGTANLDGWMNMYVCFGGSATQNSGASETDLVSCVVPANTIRKVDAVGMRYTVAGRMNTNANAKRVRLYFDSTLLWDSGSIAANGSAWMVNCIGYRSGGTGMRLVCQGNVPGTTASATTDVITTRTGFNVSAFSNALTFKTTGLGVATGDVIQETSEVEVRQ